MPSLEDILLFLIVTFLLLLFFSLLLLLFFRAKRNAKKTSLQKVMDAVLLPVNFGALFLENRRIEQLPAYYRYFLKFTRFTSRIKYFHFFPKALVALLAEAFITVSTGENVLTAIVFSWSIFFLIFVSIVEDRFGNMEEDTITFANKLFLYTVSMLSLTIFLAHFFFWDTLESSFDNPFFHFMGEMAHLLNEYILKGIFLFFQAPLWIKISALILLIIYVFTAVYYSRYKEKTKK